MLSIRRILYYPGTYVVLKGPLLTVHMYFVLYLSSLLFLANFFFMMYRVFNVLISFTTVKLRLMVLNFNHRIE